MRFGRALWKTMRVIISLPLSVYLQRIWSGLWYPTLQLPPTQNINIHRDDSLFAVCCSPGIQNVSLCWLKRIFFIGNVTNHESTTLMGCFCYSTCLCIFYFQWNVRSSRWLWICQLAIRSSMLTLHCSSVNSQADSLILRLALVKATTGWVRRKLLFGWCWTLKAHRDKWGDSCLSRERPLWLHA